MRRTVVVIVAMLVVAACGNAAENIAEQAIEADGGGDVDIEVDDDGETVSMEFEDEDGSGSVSFGGGEIPDDFPLPVPDGGDVIQVVELSDGSQSVSMQYDPDDFESLSEEFVDHFSQFSDTQTSTGTGESPFLNLISEEGGVSVSIIVTPEGALTTLIRFP